MFEKILGVVTTTFRNYFRGKDKMIGKIEADGLKNINEKN